MGPLFYAGSCDQLKWCIEDLKKVIPVEVIDYVQSNLDVQPNENAGDRELSKQWNECLEAIKILSTACIHVNGLFSEEEFNRLYEVSNGFEDKLPSSPPVRPEGESFGEFILKGSAALIKEHPELVKQLL